MNVGSRMQCSERPAAESDVPIKSLNSRSSATRDGLFTVLPSWSRTEVFRLQKRLLRSESDLRRRRAFAQLCVVFVVVFCQARTVNMQHICSVA